MVAYKLDTFHRFAIKKWRNFANFNETADLWFQLLGVQVPSATPLNSLKKRMFLEKCRLQQKIVACFFVSILRKIALFYSILSIHFGYSNTKRYKLDTLFRHTFSQIEALSYHWSAPFLFGRINKYAM